MVAINFTYVSEALLLSSQKGKVLNRSEQALSLNCRVSQDYHF
jgi:hypothetical protein